MSVSIKQKNSPSIIRQVSYLYLEDSRKLTVEQIGKELGVTHATVTAIIKDTIDPEVHRAEKALRYSRSKTGANSPMFGKCGLKHPNWKGVCSDHKGHFTMKMGGKRYFYHRIVFAEMLGIPPSQLPQSLTVHHIDGDPSNNSLDNLALVTKSGHKKLHRSWNTLRTSPLWELYKHSILR